MPGNSAHTNSAKSGRRSSHTDVLREVGAQDLVELIQLVVAHAHEEESEDRVARILDAAELQGTGAPSRVAARRSCGDT